MEKIASTLIIIGALLWSISLFVTEGHWRPQMLAAAIMIVGIVAAHVWEELFRKED